MRASSLVVTLVFIANNAMTQPIKSRSSNPNSRRPPDRVADRRALEATHRAAPAATRA